MRKLTFSIALVLSLASLPHPGGAATDAATAPASTPAVDTAFLASLAGEPGQPIAPAELPAIGTPAPSPRTCTISRACGDGNTASCMGTYSCVYSQKGVTCDNGTEVACPHYCVIAESCVDCNRYLTCWSLAGTCQENENGISCNGGPGRHCTCPDQQGF